MYANENLDLNSVILLLKFRRKNRKDEVLTNFNKKLVLPRLSWHYFKGGGFANFNEFNDEVGYSFKTVFYNDDDNIKYVTIANSHDDIYIVTGMFYGFESGTDDRILYKKGDSKIEVLMKDNKEENDASVIYRALYNFYRNGGKEFFIRSFKFSSSDHLVEDLFGLKPEDCFVAKPRSIECADLLFGDTDEKFPIKEENLLIGPAESAAENAPTPNEENNLPAGPVEEQPTVVEEEQFNPADQFSKPYITGEEKIEKRPAVVPGKKAIDKKKEKRPEPISDKEVTTETHRFLEKSKEFVLIFAGNKTTVESIEVTSIIIQTSRDGKLDMKKSKVVFMEHKRKGDSVRKKKSFNGFMKYLDKKWLKFSVLGRSNVSVSVFNY